MPEQASHLGTSLDRMRVPVTVARRTKSGGQRNGALGQLEELHPSHPPEAALTVDEAEVMLAKRAPRDPVCPA
jgi:hypothetical protein